MRNLLIFLLFLFIVKISSGDEYSIKSLNGKIEVNVAVSGAISYSVTFKGKEIISPSIISLTWENDKKAGKKPQIKNVSSLQVSNSYTPVIPTKYSSITDEFNELKIDFKGKYSLVFRTYNDGLAYRWITQLKDSITIANEEATFNFSGNHHIWFPEEESMFSHQERTYKYLELSEISPTRFCSTGTLVETDDGNKVLISESDLLDYPGMFLTGTKENPYGLKGKFAGYPLGTEQLNDRSVSVTRHASYLAKTKGKREFPWRVMVITDDDKKLVESNMIWKLASPSKIKDPSWIKPGKVAWDWWNDLNVYDVDFKSGVNTETYKYYIDFAAEYNIEYIILDEGWYHLEDVLKIKDEVNLPELLAYAKTKNVGIILWVTWKALYDQLDNALAQFIQWGVKGIKVDFMQRDDQWMVNYYTLVAQKAAQHKLLVDFHGAYKPTGLQRTYPNVLTFEGVAGLEQSKWGEKANPEHDLILPFIRMVAGPMDYTPGAMVNASKKSFKPIWSQPMSQGTRCHQLAMYVVYESPLQMLCDNPSNYKLEKETMDFLSAVPVVWDDSKVLEARVSDYIVIARKKDNKWFVGAMTDWEERDMNISFDFLDNGTYTLQLWQDGLNADRHASDYQMTEITITNQTSLPIHLAPGGGWVGIISLSNEKD